MVCGPISTCSASFNDLDSTSSGAAERRLERSPDPAPVESTTEIDSLEEAKEKLRNTHEVVDKLYTAMAALESPCDQGIVDRHLEGEGAQALIHTVSQDERLQDPCGDAQAWQVQRARGKFRKEKIGNKKENTTQHTPCRNERFSGRYSHRVLSGMSMPARLRS